jgi:hypothetical protein
MEYKVIIAYSRISVLEDAVNAAMAAGWWPQGGVCATTHQGSGVITFYQAMTRAVPESESEVKLTEPELPKRATRRKVAVPVALTEVDSAN